MGTQRQYEKQRQRASDRRRRAVLEAAGMCFAERGFEGTTTQSIARRAGVSKGLVFHFFGSKQALLSEVVEDCLQAWSLLTDFRASESGDSALSELHMLFTASFDFVEHYPVISLFSRPDSDVLTKYHKEVEKRNNNWRRRLRKTVQRGVDNGEIDPDVDVARFSKIFHELQTALIQNPDYKGPGKRYDRETVVLAVDTLINGILPRGVG